MRDQKRPSRLPVGRIALRLVGSLRRVVGPALEEALQAVDPVGPGGSKWTPEEVDATARALALALESQLAEVLREVLLQRGQLALGDRIDE